MHQVITRSGPSMAPRPPRRSPSTRPRSRATEGFPAITSCMLEGRRGAGAVIGGRGSGVRAAGRAASLPGRGPPSLLDGGEQLLELLGRVGGQLGEVGGVGVA